MQKHAPSLLRIAHISDLHCAAPNWDPTQLLSKRWLGNLNVLFSRKSSFDPYCISTLIPHFRKEKVQVIAITGDLSSTSHPDEFKMAKELIDSLTEEGFAVYTLPGNHDQYTKHAEKEHLFYNFFSPLYAPDSKFSLKDDKVSSAYLGNSWWIMGLDNAYASSLVSANGKFSIEAEQALKQALTEIPKDHSVILINHFSPFGNVSARKLLFRKEDLLAILREFPCIKLFLHGHTHRHAIADLRGNNLPIICDAGSTAFKKTGTWNLIDIKKDQCTIQAYRQRVIEDETSWEPFSTQNFLWKKDAALV